MKIKIMNNKKAEPSKNLKLFLDQVESNELSETEIVKAGKINLPSGNIITSDMLNFTENRTLNDKAAGVPVITITSPIGTFPVEFICNKKTERIDLSRIIFSENKIKYFKRAYLKEVGSKTINTENIGFRIDSGYACYIDEKSWKYYCDTAKNYAMKEAEYQNNKSEIKKHKWEDELYFFYEDYIDNKIFENKYTWTNLNLFKNNYNILIFSSGMGDGGYGSYWAYDENDNIVQLITDFVIFDLNID